MADKWTSLLVAGRIQEAAKTLQRLPIHHPGRKIKSSWPGVVREPMEAYGYNEFDPKPSPPTAAAIDRMDEVMVKWIRWLTPEEVRILWLWVLGAPATIMARRLGVHRTTIHRKKLGSLKRIAVMLNQEGTPVCPAAEEVR